MKRRNLMIGLGALSAGSGATMVTGAFSGSAETGGDGLTAVSTAEVNLDPDPDDEHNADTSDVDPGDDLPLVNVSDEGEDDLAIDIVNRIDASEEEIENLFAIENLGTEPIEASIDLIVNDDLVDFDDSELDKQEIRNAYTFEIGDEDADDGVFIDWVDGSGPSTKKVDLTVDLQNIIGDLQSEGIGSPGGNPFDEDGIVGDAETLVDTIEITADATDETYDS